jgi:hypothetical protein
MELPRKTLPICSSRSKINWTSMASRGFAEMVTGG